MRWFYPGFPSDVAVAQGAALDELDGGSEHHTNSS